MKKYGVFKYNTRNIGDEIQSLAAAQFLPRIDYYVDRDHMSAFTANEDVYMIFNGWFKRGLSDWPPPDNIHPLFISFHITEHDQAHRVLANPKSKDYYKKFEPIGCRDYHTVKLLRNIGVDAYFSSCLTLTFQNNFRKRDDHIYFVDPFGSDDNYIWYLPGDRGFRNNLWKQFPQDIRERAIFLTHEYSEKDYMIRFRRAQELIDKYSRAKLVITSRLHCALPCLAMGTPVIFIYRNLKKPVFRSLVKLIRPNSLTGIVTNMPKDLRFDGLMDLMRCYSLTDIKDNNFNINWENPYPNPVDISDMANNLRKTCESFVRGE